MGFSKYLTTDEMRDIAVQEFRDAIRNKSSKDLERIISNSAYQVVWSAVDSCMDGEASSVLKAKVLAIIDGMTAFNVFATPNAWERGENMAHNLLVEAVRANHTLLEQRVVDQIGNLSKSQIAEIASEVMKEKLSKVI